MDLKLPPLGEGADSGTVVNLFVKEGDQVSKDQPILELENEKAVATIPSTAAGTVTRIFVRTGDKITVGQRILSLSDGEPAAPAPSARSEAGPELKTQKQASGEPPPGREEAEARRGEAVIEPKQGIAPVAAPSIRKLASDLGIDLARV